MPRNKLQKAEHKRQAAELRKQGQSIREIGAEIGLHYSSVQRDLKEIEAELIEDARADMAEHRARTLAKLRHIQIESQRAWALSMQDKIKIADNGAEQIRTIETQSGNPAHLSTFLKAAIQEARLLGLYENVDIEQQDNSAQLLQAIAKAIESGAEQYGESGCDVIVGSQAVAILPDNGRRNNGVQH